MLASVVAITLIAASSSVRLAVLIPLACLAIMLLIPIAAFRGMFHIPGYCGYALLALTFGLIVGKIAGAQIPGSAPGVGLSIVFFLAMATSLGAILAIFVYRQPPGQH